MAEKKQATQISLFQNPPDKELIAAIKRVPPQYRGQIIALAHYLQLQKAHEEKVKAKVTDVIHKNKKAKIPIIQEANRIISGERGLNEEEKKYVVSNLRPNEKPEPSDFGGDQIQDYWLKVFTNCERLRKEVHELDYPVLKSLRTIEHILDEQDKYNFTLRFTFGENEYFSDEVLTVRFVMANQGVDIARIEATPINWKEKKNYIKRMVQFKQQNKKTGQTRVVQRPMQIHSFFNFFKSMRPKGTEDEQDRALREMGLRHNLALLIRDEVLTYHLEYFVGKRSGGIDYPLYLDHIREEADETSSPNKSQKKNDKEEKKVQKSPGTKKAEAIKPTGKQAETAKPKEPENKGCGVQ